MKMAHKIVERYNATPYAFRFSTRQRADNELDSKMVKISRTYYLGGHIETLAQVEKRNDQKEEILLSNMRCNGWKKIIVNDNSWRSVHPFRKGDVLLNFIPMKKEAA
jgi:hypothetical protein